MSGFFQRLTSKGRPAAESAEPRLVLAVFGKHPGWDDHIPGIGVETEALAYVKQALYVGGIGRQIDSGAWEKMEPEKRIEGFDHLFLWQRDNSVLLGELWSSVDRKGRSKYPMVLCVDGENTSVDFILERACGELDKLRVACKAATTAEQVMSECKAAQDRLRESGGFVEIKYGAPSSVETRRRFLEHPDVGPEKIGLLRLLHELRITSANGSGRSGAPVGGNKVRLCHLRVPATGHSNAESMALWSAFFQSAVPKGTSVLLFGRKTVNWLDAIIGEPDSDDFFCLGAGLSAIPLTTQIPYDLSPELKSNLERIESGFLGVEAAKPAGVQSAPAIHPPIDERKAPVIPQSPKKRNWFLPLVLCVVVLGGAGGFLFIWANRSANTKVVETKPPATASTSAAPVSASGTAAVDNEYNAAINDARAALNRGEYPAAISKAEQALNLKKGDAAAAQLKSEALAQQQAMEARAHPEDKYQRAIGAAQLAFNQADYATALSQAEAALQIKPNDPSALKLKTDSKSQLDLAAFVTNQNQQKYETAMASAQAAMDRRDFPGAVAQADAAMSIRTNDAAAAKLKAVARSMMDSATQDMQRQQKYEAAMADARAAFEQKDYARVIAKTAEALSLRPNDAVALTLKRNTQALLEQADKGVRYTKMMSSAQTAYSARDFSNAIAQAQAALVIRPGDSAATALLKQATADKDLQDAQADVDRGDLANAKLLCSSHAGVAAFDALADKIKTMETGRFDTELEVYQVRFGLLDPRKAKTAEAQRETRWLGELTIQQRDQCLKDVEAIQAAFQAAGRMDAVRGKELNDLKETINDHL